MRPSIWVVLALAGCASPGILGGPTQDNTTRVCPDGTRCENWQDCPNYSTPGRCEMPGGGIVEQEGLRHPVDAGK